MCCVDRHQPRHDTREAHKYTFDYSNSWGTWGQNSFCLIGVRQEINKYKKKPTAWREFLSSDVILIYVDGWMAAGGSWRDVASGNNKRVGWISCSSPVCSHFAQVSVSPRDSLCLSVSLCLPGPPWPVHAHTCATRGPRALSHTSVMLNHVAGWKERGIFCGIPSAAFRRPRVFERRTHIILQ